MIPILAEVALPRAVRLPAGAVPPIPPPQALVHAARAGAEVHDLAARRVRVLLSGTRGVERVEGDGIPLAAALGIHGATGANLLVGPRGARRECFAPAGGLLETVQLPEALPGILIQWTPAGAPPSRGGRLLLSACLLPLAADTAEVRFHRAPGLLWVARGDTGVLLTLPGVGAVPDLRLRNGEILVEWDLPPG
ncbi:MAG TPA: hypothetical protein VLA43_10560, partial [Longimicrobiales bacterium]|nr:hypothetical protein [Longimicrobiales bacterium]